MGIYWFAVDYNKKQQMWAPGNWAVKAPGVYGPSHPLPSMIFMKNSQGSDFQVVCDISTYNEHSFEDVTDSVFEELKRKFPESEWND